MLCLVPLCGNPCSCGIHGNRGHVDYNTSMHVEDFFNNNNNTCNTWLDKKLWVSDYISRFKQQTINIKRAFCKMLWKQLKVIVSKYFGSICQSYVMVRTLFLLLVKMSAVKFTILVKFVAFGFSIPSFSGFKAFCC